MQLLHRVRRFVRAEGLIPAGTRVLAAVSGGPDSVALAYLLRDLDAAGGAVLAGLVHVNHQLRPTANLDEGVAVDLARALGIPVVVERHDVAARAAHAKQSIESTAHAVRYECFERARRQLHADVVAVGHTRDDQAETVVMRALRGAGPRGLSGMHPRHGRVIRPLLTCRRQDLRDLLIDGEIAFVEDESNQDIAIPRNRVRAELLPFIAARFNPGIVDALADQAVLEREVSEWLEGQVDDVFARFHQVEAPLADGAFRSRIDLLGLAGVPRAVVRATVWRAMTRAGGGRSIDFDHVEAALNLTLACEGAGDRALDMPGHRLERIGADLVLTGRPTGLVGRRLQPVPVPFRCRLPVPGEVSVPGGALVGAVDRGFSDRPTDTSCGATPGGASARVRRDACRGGLTVRSRRPGDRFKPLGLGGRKKLQDFFVDRKVPRSRRDTVPLVVDESDRIVWVAGHGIDEAFRVTDPAQGVLILTFRFVGGST